MDELLQQLLNALALGSVYALIALGYSMVYGVLGFINFAHSEVFMVGAFAGFFLAALAPVSSILGGLGVLIGAMCAAAILGVLLERLAYRPLRNRSKLSALITAIGVSLLLQNAGQVWFGAAPRGFPELFPTRNFTTQSGIAISSNQLVVIGTALVLLFALRHIVMKTRMGTAMRAVSFNPTAASLVGINVNAVIAFTFALGSALAAAGGILYALNYRSIDPLMGSLPGMKAFVAAVLGGIGSIPGAALGGLLIGVVETFVNGSAYSTYTDAIAFAVLIVVLLVRPAGLLGSTRPEKV